jgi:hypothetical protein
MLRKGVRMVVSANKCAMREPIPLNELARQDAFWTEIAYLGGSKFFGEAEPVHYFYQIREGAIHTEELITSEFTHIRTQSHKSSLGGQLCIGPRGFL